MVDAVLIAPVGGITVGADGLNDDLLLGFAEGDGEEYLVAFGYVEVFAEVVSLNGGQHTAAEAFVNGTEENTLGSDAVVNHEVLAYLGIPEDNDIGGGAFTFGGAGPVGKGGGPGKVLENQGVLCGVAGKDVLEGLAVGGGCRTPGEVNEFPEGFRVDGNLLVEAAVAPVLQYQIFNHNSLLSRCSIIAYYVDWMPPDNQRRCRRAAAGVSSCAALYLRGREVMQDYYCETETSGPSVSTRISGW